MRRNAETACDLISNLGSVVTSYDVQAQIEASRTTSGSQDVAVVHVKNIGINPDLWVLDGESISVGPVHGRAPSVEQPCCCKEEKRPLGFQGSEEPATSTGAPYSHLPASEEGTSMIPSTGATQNAATTVSPLSDPHREFQSALASNM